MSTENESKTVQDYIKELNAILSNPNDLSYEDVKKSIDVAYGAVTQNADEGNDIENARELKSIMDRLIMLSNIKKPSEQKIVSKKINVSSKPVEETPKEEKKIPKPVIDDNAEVKVDSAVSAVEPSKEEIEKAYIKEPQTVVDNRTVVVEGDLVVNQDPVKSEDILDATVSETKSSVKPTKKKIKKVEPVEEETTSMEIDTPTIEEQIFVSDQKDEIDDESDEDFKNPYEPDNEPFEGDDDLDVEGDEDLSNIEFENTPSKEEQRIAKITESYSSVPEGMHMMNVKNISRKKMSDTLKALGKINTENLNIDKINMFEYNGSDENIRKEYLKTRNDMVASPKVSRIGLIMSGHYEEISSYGNYDLVSIQRNISNPDVDFVDREMLMYNSIYDHVKFVSYAKEKPSFEEWAKHIYYPDVGSLYYGVYDANSVGDNDYSFRCPFCGEAVSVSKKNRDLTVAVPEELTSDSLESFITTKDLSKKDFTPIAKWARTAVVRKQLSNSKIIVDYAVPTLYDYLVVLNTARRVSQRDLNNTLDISSIELFNNNGNEEDAMRILAYLYIKAIGVPSKVEGSNKFRYIRLTEKADIIEYVNSLDLEDYNELFNGTKVQDMLTKNATRYYIEDALCSNPDCKRTIKYISLDPKQIFFFKIGEERTRMM